TDFTISDGTVSGTNLFHSFNQFNLTSAQSATFTYGGMGTIDNVVGRILGGASSIDGLIGFDGTLPSSNLYLINPAGIVFGANAQLNVPGSFHASTADYVTFSNGETWGAFVPATQTLSTAPPSAFGFLGDASFNSIAVQSGASLSVDTNNTLSLVGSGITVDNAALNVESGQVNLISIASAGTVSSLDSTPSATGIGGNVDVTGTTINVSGADNDAGADGAGGSVYIKGGNLALNGGSVFALHYSDTTDAGDFDFKATGDLDLTNAFVYSGANLFNPSTGGDADSGDITFNAGTFTATGSNIYSLAGGASSSGNIVVSANDGVTESYDYANSVYPTAADADIVIDNSTFYSAALSTASYDADASGVDPGYIFFSSDSLYMNSGDIYASTFSDNAASSAGYVYLFGNYSYLTNSSQVHTDTTSAGDAGYILLIGTDWLVDGGSSITSDATISATTGSAGDIRITVDNFVLDNATMGTSVLGSGSGDAGGITVDDCFIFCGGFFGSEFDPTDSFTLKNGASLVSDTQTGTGNAGDITIHTGVLTIESGSTVSSVTNSGLGGSINFDVLTSVTIDGAGTEVKADSIGSGPAGDVNISTENDLSLFDMADAAGDSVTIQNDASVSSSSETDVGDAGAVVVETDDLVIQGTDTVINTTTNAGQGGNITLTVGNTATISGGANIVSNTTGDGDAGAIMIAGGEWDLTGTGTITDYIIESSQISNGLGDAGDITIDVSKLSMNGSAVVASSTTSTTVGPLGETSDAGNIDVTVNDGMAVDWTDDTTFENTADLKLGNTSGINGFHSLSCEYAGSSCVSGTGVGKAGTISINTESLYADTADIIAYTIDSGDNTVVGGVGSLDIDAQYALVEGVTYIKADTFGAGDAGSIDIDGIEWVVRGASYITSTSDPFTAMDAGDAGGINITGTNISIEGGSTVSSSTTGSGDAGNIYIYANTIDVLSNSRVESKSQSSGTPGIVALLATLGSTATQALTVDNSVISASNVDGVVNGDLDSYTWLRTFGTGTIQNGSTIESKTTGNGDAGSIYIQNGNWTIDNSSVTSSQTGTTGTGSAGTIWIGASPTNPTQRFLGILDIQNGASVTSETTSTNAASDAGNILIYANTDITIDNATVSSSTGAGSPGNAGTIDISTEQDVALGTDVATDSVTIQGTATVSTDSSQGTGPAGDITITTDNFLIDGATIT
ncbi:MAG: filamentous hemagglutinin N-terminal domain-containing protein, partial [Granulosicoccaceae bacterium]